MNDVAWYVGLPTDVVIIESLEISPDPPKPGQDLTVTLKARAAEIVEVSRPGDCDMRCWLTVG